MNEIQAFNFESNQIRVQSDEQGNPWWVAGDICEALGLETHKAVLRIDEDDRNSMPIIDSLGRNQGAWVVNESGLFSLILGSKKAAAKKFKKWVTSEVLPSIRKTGSYSFQQNGKLKIIPTAHPVFSALKAVAQEFGLEYNQALLYANKATLRETGVDFQNVLQIELKNPVQVRQFTPTELGERLGQSAIKFNRQLESLGFQEKKNNVWCATEKGKPYSVLLDAGKKHSDGTPIQQLKWLETILQFLNVPLAI